MAPGADVPEAPLPDPGVASVLAPDAAPEKMLDIRVTTLENRVREMSVVLDKLLLHSHPAELKGRPGVEVGDEG